MTLWQAARSLTEPSSQARPLQLAGLVTWDPALRQEVPALLTPETAVVHLDPAGALPCPAPVDLVMIDSGLLTGAHGARWLEHACLPCLVLVRPGDLEGLDSVLRAALTHGTRDLVVWPCHALELRLRMDRLLAGSGRPRLVCGPVVVDQARLEAWVAGEALALTPREFAVLRELTCRCDRVVERRELLAAVWGWDEDHASNVVDVAIAGLRRKLAGHAGLIRTVRGVGYRLVPSAGRRDTGSPVPAASGRAHR